MAVRETPVALAISETLARALQRKIDSNSSSFSVITFNALLYNKQQLEPKKCQFDSLLCQFDQLNNHKTN